MYASLDGIDLVFDTEAGKVAVQTDHRTADELEEAVDLSSIFALTRVINAWRQPGIVGVVCAYQEGPPPVLVDVIEACGAAIEVADVRVHEAVPPQDDVVNGLAHLALRRLGQAVFRRAGVPVGEDGLKALEYEVLQARGTLRPEDDPVAWWTHVVEIAAATGEVLMAEGDHRWELAAPDSGLALVPLLLKRGTATVNVFGRSERFLQRGRSQAPSGLLGVLEGGEVGEGEAMLKLVRPDYAPPNPVQMEPLLGGDDPRIPHVAYGKDLPNAFAYYRAGTAESDFEVLRAEAMPALQRVGVRVETVAEVLVVVHGDYYASEKLLDPDFMRTLHEKLGAELLAAAVPVRGILAAVDGSQVAHVAALQQFVALQREDAEAPEHISSAVFGVHDGKPLALVELSAE